MNTNDSITRLSTDLDALERIVMHAFGLRPVIRRAFLLCDIRGFTVAEAAAILGISPAAVMARLNRARREMNVRLAVRPADRTPPTPHTVRVQ
jgi:DNA-directed RNA polymerase specialized sigma24 family protein